MDPSTERAPFRYELLLVALLQIDAAFSSEALATATSSLRPYQAPCWSLLDVRCPAQTPVAFRGPDVLGYATP